MAGLMFVADEIFEFFEKGHGVDVKSGGFWSGLGMMQLMTENKKRASSRVRQLSWARTVEDLFEQTDGRSIEEDEHPTITSWS